MASSCLPSALGMRWLAAGCKRILKQEGCHLPQAMSPYQQKTSDRCEAGLMHNNAQSQSSASLQGSQQTAAHSSTRPASRVPACVVNKHTRRASQQVRPRFMHKRTGWACDLGLHQPCH